MLLGIIFVIIFLSVLILVHELGHFLAAKKFGLWVEEFGFGLPPRLWGKKIGETIWSINWLPFGGFVKIYGEDGEEGEERRQTPIIRKDPNDPNKTRIVEKELSYQLNGLFFETQKELGRFSRERQYAFLFEAKLKERGIKYKREHPVSREDDGSNIVDFLIEDRLIVEFKTKPFLTKDDFFQIMRYLESANLELGIIVNFRSRFLRPKRILNPKFRADSENKEFRVDSGHSGEFVSSGYARSFSSLPIWKRVIIIAAGVLMNFLLGWLVISIVFSIGIPQSILITEVKSDSPAAQAGLKEGDRIIAASDFRIISDSGGSTSQILTPIREEVEPPEIDSKSFIRFIDANRGQEISLGIQRGEDFFNINIIPRKTPPPGQGALGIGLIEAGAPKQNIFAALWGGLKASAQITKTIFVLFFNLIRGVFVGERELLQSVTGPVGIVKVTNEAGKLGFVYLLQLLSLISLNLAVINILPFPALDGGRLLFLIIEKIKGSPLPLKFEKYAHAVGMALLLFLMALITIKDISTLL